MNLKARLDRVEKKLPKPPVKIKVSFSGKKESLKQIQARQLKAHQNGKTLIVISRITTEKPY